MSEQKAAHSRIFVMVEWIDIIRTLLHTGCNTSFQLWAHFRSFSFSFFLTKKKNNKIFHGLYLSWLGSELILDFFLLFCTRGTSICLDLEQNSTKFPWFELCGIECECITAVNNICALLCLFFVLNGSPFDERESKKKTTRKLCVHVILRRIHFAAMVFSVGHI